MQVSRTHILPFAKTVKLNSLRSEKAQSLRLTAQAETHSWRCHLEAAESEEQASWGQWYQTAQKSLFPWRLPTCCFSNWSGSHVVWSRYQHLFQKQNHAHIIGIFHMNKGEEKSQTGSIQMSRMWSSSPTASWASLSISRNGTPSLLVLLDFPVIACWGKKYYYS